MSNIRNDRTSFTPQIVNSWGRLRVGTPTDVLKVDSVLKYGVEPGYETTSVGSGTATFLPDQSAYELSVGTASGDKIIRQTTRAQNYNPGRGTLVVQSGAFGPQKTGVRSRIGFFNDQNGLFFERDENNISVVIRSSTTGSPSDITINQSSWNVDRFDGTGPSGLTLNPDLIQMFSLDFQWLGAGQVRFGFYINGSFILAHEENKANSISQPYMSRASLPLRFELENIASTSSSSTMIMIGNALITEGDGQDPITYPHSTNSGFTSITVPQGTWTPIFSFELKQSINSVPVTGYAVLRELNVLSDADTPALYQVVRNSTLTGANFTDHAPESLVRVDTSATGSVGGNVGFQQLVNGNKDISAVQDSKQQDLTLHNGDIYTVRARSLSATEAEIFAVINWFEVY